MATVRKAETKRGVSWRVEIRRRGHVPIYESFHSKRDAERFVAKIESDMHERRHFGLGRVRTVSDLLDRYETTVGVLKTSKDRLRHLQWWRVNYGGLALEALGSEKISEARERLLTDPFFSNPNSKGHLRLKRRSGQTVRHYLNAIGCALEHARTELRWIEKNPCRDVKKPAPGSPRVRWLSDHERDGLLVQCELSKNPDLLLVVLLALSSGARASEILNLKWPQVDLANQVAWLASHETKTRNPRAVPLVGRALELIRARSKIRRLDTELLFPGKANPHAPRNVRQAFAVATKRSGLRDLRFHDLRHDSATSMLRAGVDSRVVASVLGHTTLAMMQRYQHVAPAFVVEAATRGAQRTGI